MAKKVISQGILYDAGGHPIIDLTQNPATMNIPLGATSGGGYALSYIIGRTTAIVTTTALVNLISAQIVYTGLYRVDGYLGLANGTSGNDVLGTVSAFMPEGSGGADVSVYLFALGASPIPLEGNSAVNNDYYPLISQSIYCDAGTNLVVSYQDPANTPNDFISVNITHLG